MDLKIIECEKWGYIPQNIGSLRATVSKVFTGNTHTEPCDSEVTCMDAVQRIQDRDVNTLNMGAIRFNFIIGGDGNIYEGQGWKYAPVLPFRFSKFAKHSILIGFVGEFTGDSLRPNMDKRACDLIEVGVQQCLIKRDFLYYDLIGSQDEVRDKRGLGVKDYDIV